MKKIGTIGLFSLLIILFFGSTYYISAQAAIMGNVLSVSQYSIPEFRACIAVTVFNRTDLGTSISDKVNILSSDPAMCNLLSQALISNYMISFSGDPLLNPPPPPDGRSWGYPVLSVWKITLFGYN